MKTSKKAHVRVSPVARHEVMPLTRVTGSFHLGPTPNTHRTQRTFHVGLVFSLLSSPFTPQQKACWQQVSACLNFVLGAPDPVQCEHISLIF